MREIFLKTAGFVLRFANFRFYYRVCSFFVKRLEGEQLVVFDSFQIQFDKSDPYWSQLISKFYRYESDIENWLRKECSPDVFFIDCGANIGYWSIFVSKVLKVRNFIAVEPNPHIFELLMENLKINNLPCSAIQAAIGEVSQENSTVNLYLNSSPGNHVGASIYKENTSYSEIIEVPVVQFSELIEPAIKANQNVILKLDVEGAERSIIKLIPKSIKNRIRIIYEDHGRDRDCLTTKLILSLNVYKIYFLSSVGSIEIKNIEDLVALKRSKKKGYNLVAIPI